jgi:hypothetical protein
MRPLSSRVRRIVSRRTRRGLDLPVVRFPISEDELNTLADSARDELQALSKVVLEGRRPPPGAYAFFHHSSHTLARLKDCQLILKRLFEQRRLLTTLAWQHRHIREREEAEKNPGPRQALDSERLEAETVEYMQLDFESLYLFGGTLLDQWAYQAIAVGGVPFNERQREKPFISLLDYLEVGKGQDGPLAVLWKTCGNSMIWIHSYLRVYRNTFVVHANRPWQRGNNRGLYGEDFQLHTPTPPGWLDDK